MKASFVIPTFNVRPYLRDCLLSLVSQTEQDFEAVIVDDGSTDGTRELLREILENPEDICNLGGRLRVEFAEKNSGGPYQPRKQAILLAGSSIVAPLDADDTVGPDYLANLLRRKEECNAEIVYPAMYRFDGTYSYRILPEADFDAQNVRSGRDIVKDTLSGWRFGAGGGLIDRELYLKCFGKYDSTIAYTFADEVLTRQLLIEAKRVAFDEEPYHYRINPQSATQKISKACFMLTRSHRALISLIREEYGEDSPEFLEANRQLFHGFFDAVRLYAAAKSSSLMTPEVRQTALEEIQSTWHTIDWQLVKGHVSPRYYLLGKTGIKATIILLPLYDKIKR
ncbi:MAG: glycosyltransferase family 2 protein [Bacteroidales bacterium]|nr:glycosyltransferase family 2 protein [Bacteroidales bacterium]